jgi:peptidyl-prolyl cis-trans isomerase D
MLELIRRFAKTWPARILFGVLVAAFGLWGVAGKLYDQTTDTAVAHVGAARVELAEAQRAYTLQITKLQKQNGADYQPPQAERLQIAEQVVQQLVLEKALANEITRLGVTAPDAAVRDTTFALPAFKGIGGSFDRATFLQVLARNNLDEAGFIQLVRDDLTRQQIIGTVGAGVGTPELMLDQVFAYARETRTVAAVSFPIAAVTTIPTPTDAQLHRFWANNPTRYATPEYRRIKLIVLSPDTLAGDMPVTDKDIKTYYNAARATYQVPEKRTVRIISAPDQPTAVRLAAAWQAGADWPSIQSQTKQANATALELADAKQIELPDPALAAAAFAAAQDTVSAPIKGDFGWYVARVTKITPATNTTLEQASADIRHKVGVMKANEQIDDRANKVEDALAGGGGLDTLPAGLGVAAVEGTLDAQGNQPDGTPAPIPAYPELRAAIIAAAFKAKPNDPPSLQQLPATKDRAAGAYYAVTIDHITPPARLPYDRAAARVQQDWTTDQQRRAAETQAAQLLTTVRAGAKLPAAATAAGLTATTLPPIPRPFGETEPPPGVPQALVAPLFGMKPNDVTMVNTPDGFMVAQLQAINAPSPATDPIGATQMRGELAQSTTSDVTDLFVEALQHRSKITLNQPVIAQLAQP